VAAQARIRDLLTAATRCVRRLDLIVRNELGHDNVVQAQWKQLRRLEDPRGSRTASEPATAAPANGAGTPPPGGNTPEPQDGSTTSTSQAA